MKEGRIEELDLVAVAELDAIVFPESWGVEDYRPFITSEMSFCYQISDRQGRLRAYIVAQISFDEAEVIKIAVHPQYQRQGYGSRLLEVLLAHCFKEGVERLWLEYRQSAVHTAAFYRRWGFIPMWVRPQYYRDGEAAQVCCLTVVEEMKKCI